jgi:uncharacterized protein
MTTPEFSVSVSSLDAGGKSFTFPVRPAWLLGALEGCDASPTEHEGRIEVRLSTSGRDVVAHGRLEAEIQVPCARCTSPAKVSISQDFSVLFVPSEAVTVRGDDEEVVASEDPDSMPFDGDTVVLDDFVRDEILLETPMFPLCSDACEGMSPPPGSGAEASASTNIDPRLLPLLRWKTPEKS